MPIPDFLIHRYKDWKDNVHSSKKEFFNTLEKQQQKPKAMIISCCDSRVQPDNIFKAVEGDLFVHRNIANLIPPLNIKNSDYATSSAIDYAIDTLKIRNLIILGHSNCGGINHAYKIFSKEILNNNSNLDKWIKIVEPAYNGLKISKDRDRNIELLEKLSIINSMSNLILSSKIEKLVSNNELKINGLWFEISSGKLMQYDKKIKKFENLI